MRRNDDFPMDLPQTAAGVPAPGIDPTVEELDAITSVQEVFDWLGSAKALGDALVAAMGGGRPRLRDLVYIAAPAWTAAVQGIRIAGEGGGRELLPIELGHLAMVRRIARLRLQHGGKQWCWWNIHNFEMCQAHSTELNHVEIQ